MGNKFREKVKPTTTERINHFKAWCEKKMGEQKILNRDFRNYHRADQSKFADEQTTLHAALRREMDPIKELFAYLSLPWWRRATTGRPGVTPATENQENTVTVEEE